MIVCVDALNGAKSDATDSPENPEKGKPIQNKIDGLQREAEVRNELEEKYPAEEGYEIISEAYLRDADGNIVKDPETGKARRIDFVVVKDGKVVASIEVTSKTADKSDQLAKESRIRDNGEIMSVTTMAIWLKYRVMFRLKWIGEIDCENI